jgi:hypothetical protein
MPTVRVSKATTDLKDKISKIVHQPKKRKLDQPKKENKKRKSSK